MVLPIMTYIPAESGPPLVYVLIVNVQVYAGEHILYVLVSVCLFVCIIIVW